MTTTTIAEPSDAHHPKVQPARVALVAIGIGGLLAGAFALGRVTGDTARPGHVTPTTIPSTVAPQSPARNLLTPPPTDDDDHCRVGKPC